MASRGYVLPGVALGPYLWNDRNMQKVTLKTSTIFISKGAETRVYRSVAEIPHSLRQQLEECTNGFNSATILIADRRGREEIRRALTGMPSTLRTRLSSSLHAEPSNQEEQAPLSQTAILTRADRDMSGFLMPKAIRNPWIAAGVSAACLLVWAIAHFR